MRILLALLTITYPAIVYVSTTNNFTTLATAILATTIAFRSISLLQKRGVSILPRIILGLITGAIVYEACSFAPSSPLFYPVMVSGALFAIFALSLRTPPSIIERIATSLHGSLPPAGTRYCRNVTKVWAAFFAVNFLIALDSTSRPLGWWSLYNGLISYCIIGVIFGGEYAIRRRIMKRIGVAVAILASLSVTGPAFSQSLSVEQLREQLRPPAPFRASFTEKRFIAVLSAPLESRGEMECIPGEGLIWKTTYPVTKTSIITPNGLTILEEAGEPQALSDRANISEALLSLMSGDTEKASRTFTIVPSGSVTQWSLTLTPTDSLVAEILEKIIVKGRQRPESIEIHHANKDKIITSFSPPLPLSPSEVAHAQATVHEAS